MIIAHLSDLHLSAEDLTYGVVDTDSTSTTVVDWLNQLDPLPDLCLITGDIAADGSASAYASAQRILAKLRMPFRVVPGNHDHKAQLEHALMRDHSIVRFGQKICWSEFAGGMRIIGLDTVIPGEHHGGLSLDLLQWLEDELDKNKVAPVLICMHHPPIPLGIAPMDHSPFENARAFAQVLEGRANVLRLLAGHAHRTMVQEFAGRPLFVAPSVSMQFELNFRNDAQENFILEPNQIGLHLLREDWLGRPTLISHVASIPEPESPFSGPFPFL